MPSLRVGSVRTCAHKKVVVLKTGLKDGGEDAVQVAPIIKAEPAGGPSVEIRTGHGPRWVLVGQVSTVKSASLATVWWGLENVKADAMKLVQKGIGELGG
ncbi:hypothetical protein [Lentzea sp. HUAS12]|uniref:hypothetical protein n=1 Tax=Lentzea sp. HUAS12 TaxID=2951806 RepID=UPI0020A11DA1|nr:hypothetical protein [Lentzea sp. HUAS12]USX54745.1 hypothetical protein ND450_11740 [Lentzea sp. HUAS12]